MVVISDDGLESIRYAPPQRDAALHLRVHLLLPAGLDRERPLRLRRPQAPWARSSPARRRPTPTSSSRCRIRACRRRSASRQECGIPYELGIIRNHYVGRTFIEPTQSVRELGVRLKHSANRAVVRGKRIVLVDDSLVRGTTSVKIVRMMREAGAREVHFRIASPADHPSRFLRHRHARARQAACRDARPRGHARATSAPTPSPSCRSTASTAPWAMTAATRCGRSSPTTASPATTRRR